MPATIWVLGFASLLTDVSTEAIHGVLPLFLVSGLGATAITLGLIEGVAESIASFLKVFSGALSDCLGRRKLLVVMGYGLSSIVKGLYPIATNQFMVLAARMADRIGKGIRAAPRDALVADTTDDTNRGAAYGLRQALDTVGALLGPLMAMVVLHFSPGNYRLVFWLALIPAALAVVLLVAGIKEQPGQPWPARQFKSPLDAAVLKQMGREFWWMILIVLVFNAGNSSDAFLLLKARELDVPPEFVPLGLMVMNITYALSAYPAGKLSDRLGREGLVCGAFILYALTYLAMAFASQTWQFWSLLATYGIYLGFSQGILAAMVADKVPQEMRGTAFGVMNLALGIALFPASLAAGFLWERYSSTHAFLLSSITAGAAVLLLFPLVLRKNKATAT